MAALDRLALSDLLQAIALAAAGAIGLAGIAGWLMKAPGALSLALWAAALGLWVFLPLPLTHHDLILLRNFASILGWLWLVKAWGQYVLNDWPAPVWTHALVALLLVALGLAGIAVAFGLT